MQKHDQVQTQMDVTQLQYTDFGVWREDQVIFLFIIIINRIKFFDASFYDMITKQANFCAISVLVS